MLRLSTSVFAIAALIVTLLPQPTHAFNMNEALVRMDEIIAEMRALRAEFATLASTVNTGSQTSGGGAVLGASTACAEVLTGSLNAGDTSDAIAKVQRLLATDPAIYPYGVDSGFYGPKTTEAIRNLQTRFGLDPVGAIGPATEALLRAIMCVYPNENYPANALSKKPTVDDVRPTTGGAVTTPTPTTAPKPQNPVKSVEVEVDRGEAEVVIKYHDKNTERFIVSGETKQQIAKSIARRTGDKVDDLLAVMELDEEDDGDKEDAKDAIDDAKKAIDDAEEEIEEAEDDGDDTDWAEDTLKEAEDLLEKAEEAYDDKDYDDAIDYAEEAEEMADTAVDRIDEEEEFDLDDIDKIEVTIYEEDEEAEVVIEFKNGDEMEFTVDETDEDDILEEIAKELDLDEDDEDVIDELDDLTDFEYED